MPFVSIPSNTIDVGDPNKKELWDTVKNNEDDLDTRVTNLEISAKKITFLKFFMLNGSSFTTATGLHFYQADESFTITDVYIRIFEKGSNTGAIQIDIKRSTTDMDNASFTSIFTTKPKITYASAVDFETSTNQVFNSSQINISAGDILRLDIVETPTSGVLPPILITGFGE